MIFIGKMQRKVEELEAAIRKEMAVLYEQLRDPALPGDRRAAIRGAIEALEAKLKGETRDVRSRNGTESPGA